MVIGALIGIYATNPGVASQVNRRIRSLQFWKSSAPELTGEPSKEAIHVVYHSLWATIQAARELPQTKRIKAVVGALEAAAYPLVDELEDTYEE